MDIAKLQAELTLDEGARAKPYRDTVGKLSIGIGRNLDDVGLRPDEIALLFRNDVEDKIRQLDHFMPWWKSLPDAQARALVNMAFNLGVGGLLGFHVFLEYMEKQDFIRAAIEISNSKVSRQLPHRYGRLCQRIDPNFVLPGWMK